MRRLGGAAVLATKQEATAHAWLLLARLLLLLLVLLLVYLLGITTAWAACCAMLCCLCTLWVLCGCCCLHQESLKQFVTVSQGQSSSCESVFVLGCQLLLLQGWVCCK
jgi:hypothetical protein